MKSIIKINQLSKEYTGEFGRGREKSTALENINFDIERPTILSIIGENGAGKSTLIKLLLGLIPPTKGAIEVFGFDPYKKNKEYLRSIGFVSGQRRSLSGDLPAHKSITSSALFYGLTLSQIEESIYYYSSLFKVEHKLNQPVRTLSLGETIKFEIISAIIHEPKIIYLDEPSIGLDFETHHTIIELLQEIHRKKHVTLILTSHYIKDIKLLSKDVLVLEKGKQLFFGSFKDLNSGVGLGSYLESLNQEISKYR